MRDDGPPQPTLDAVARVAARQRLRPRRVALCWGDSRLPNLMYRADEVVAVLDWEMAFLGDPEADLGWWCFLDWANNEGYGGPHLDGIPSKDETIARYAELTGHPVEHAHWHEVFAAFRYGVVLARVAIRMRAIGASLPCARLGGQQRLHAGAGASARPAAAGRGTPHDQRRPARGGRAGAAPVPALGRGRRRLVRGRAWRHRGLATPGVVDDPDATLEAEAADWLAVQAGTLDRLQAFMDGKLRISGDLTLLMVHEELISRLGREE